MHLRPASLDDLRRALADASARREPVASWDLSALADVREYTPEDLTVTAEAGLTLGALQRRLAAAGQWLPLDPPGADTLTLERLLADNPSGPRRLGYGTVRDWVIGIAVVLADGRLVRSGGRVVKNVAGLDLAKLFIGASGSLGIVVEATFKVAPLPAAECVLEREVDGGSALADLREAALAVSPAPVRLDAWREAAGRPIRVRLGVDGCVEAVEGAARAAAALGFAPPAAPFPEPDVFLLPGLGRKVSVLPSRLPALLRDQADAAFLARLGNGVAWLPGEPVASVANPPARRVAERIKAALDPHHLLPPLPA